MPINTTGPDPATVGDAVSSATFYVTMFTFAIAGVLIVTHQPRNPIGRLLLLDAMPDFTVGLRDHVDLTSLRGSLTRTVTETIQPTTVFVWMSPPGRQG